MPGVVSQDMNREPWSGQVEMHSEVIDIEVWEQRVTELGVWLLQTYVSDSVSLSIPLTLLCSVSSGVKVQSASLELELQVVVSH